MINEAPGDKKWLVLLLEKVKGIMRELIKWLVG
jgi:hypothetical protein